MRRQASAVIERIELRRLRLPLRRPFETSFGRSDEKDFWYVAVSADGVTGHAECVADVAPHYLPETNETVFHVVRDFLAPALLGADVGHPGEVQSLWTSVRGHGMAKACLEMAVWELEARRKSIPLGRLLGGSRARIEAGVSIGLQRDVSALCDAVARELDAGYRKIKIKIAPGRDVELVAGVRARWPEIVLTVDANAAYGSHDRGVFEELDQYDLAMIEQPYAWNDFVGHADLQSRLRTPICLDESIRSVSDARTAIALRACRIVNLKVGRIGGFAAALELIGVVREGGLDLWCGGMLESGIGRLANVHLQTLDAFNMPGDTSASARVFTQDLIDPPVTVDDDGTIAVPSAPGIGHSVVSKRVEAATVFREEWRR